MSPRRCVTVAILLFALLSLPSESEAIFAWIHKMSGPTMLGFGYNCKILQPRPFDIKHRLEVARATKEDVARLAEEAKDSGEKPRLAALFGQDKCFWQGDADVRSNTNKAHYWIRLESAVLFSTSHSAEPDNRPRVWAFTPALMFEVSPTHPGEGPI